MRKSVIISVLSFAVFLVYSCGKEDVTPEAPPSQCSQNNTGYLTVTNTSEDPYYVFVDGSYSFQVDAYSSSPNNQVSIGSHYVYMEQASGFVITPSSYDWTGNFITCEKHTLTIP